MPEPIITPAYTIQACRGMDGCRHSAARYTGLLHSLNTSFLHHDFESSLRACIPGPLRHHHALRVSVSLCPNGCSRPQVADIGLIGAARIRVTGSPCSGCGRCTAVCREEAISLSANGPTLDFTRCLQCSACARVCPEGTLEPESSGLRIQLGGKLGRHPMLGRELAGIHSEQAACRVVDRCLAFYLDRFTPGKRLGDLIREMSHSELEEVFQA